MGRDALRVGPVELLHGAGEGPLAGLRFVVKDNIDVAGHRTGCGQPTWLADAASAEASAPVVEELVRAGATLVGKAHQDELAFSMSGTNVHYGAPPNPSAPDCEPGGSSSGSASIVASGRVDFALGTDTGGSVRIPASYCGILGLRPTHGRIATEGVVPLAPSFDSVGWFARSGEMMTRVGRVLCGAATADRTWRRMLLVEDALRLADPDGVAFLRASIQQAAQRLGLPLESVDLAGAQGGLDTWRTAFRILQGREAWDVFGEWITTKKPALGPGIASRFAYAASLTAPQAAAAEKVRTAARARVEKLLGSDTLLVLPSAAGVALPLAMSREEKDERRTRTLGLTSIAGLAGTPAISLPLCFPRGLPLGLCLIAARGADEDLLEAARTLLP